MASLNLNAMRANLQKNGARNTLFRVTLTNPVDSSSDVKIPFMVQAASLPAWSIGMIQVPYMGRVAHIPGDRQFQPWTVDVINDEDFGLRDAFESWHNSLQTLEGNIRASENFTSTALVEQLNKRGDVIRGYEFTAVWPMEVGQIELSWGMIDQIETFPVTFSIDSYRVVGGNTGNAGGV